jgi:hypothetical protein
VFCAGGEVIIQTDGEIHGILLSGFRAPAHHLGVTQGCRVVMFALERIGDDPAAAIINVTDEGRETVFKVVDGPLPQLGGSIALLPES